MNVVLLCGALWRDPEERTLRSGTRLVSFEVTTREPERAAVTVPVAWFDPPAAAARLGAGSEVVVTGEVRRRFFRAGGATASRTEVVADRVSRASARTRGAAVARIRARLDAEGDEEVAVRG